MIVWKVTTWFGQALSGFCLPNHMQHVGDLNYIISPFAPCNIMNYYSSVYTTSHNTLILNKSCGLLSSVVLTTYLIGSPHRYLDKLMEQKRLETECSQQRRQLKYCHKLLQEYDKEAHKTERSVVYTWSPAYIQYIIHHIFVHECWDGVKRGWVFKNVISKV